MPIYEYTCQKCKAHIEIMQKVSEKPLARHVKCGGALEKEWSRTGFQFKGSGWYVTDYAAKKSETKEPKETKSDTPTTSTAPSEGATKATSRESKSTGDESKKSTKSSPSTSRSSQD